MRVADCCSYGLKHTLALTDDLERHAGCRQLPPRCCVRYLLHHEPDSRYGVTADALACMLLT